MPRVKLFSKIIIGLICLSFLVSPVRYSLFYGVSGIFSFAVTTQLELQMSPPEEEVIPPEEEILPPGEKIVPPLPHPLFDILIKPVVEQARKKPIIPILSAAGILILVIAAYIIYRKRNKKSL